MKITQQSQRMHENFPQSEEFDVWMGRIKEMGQSGRIKWNPAQSGWVRDTEGYSINYLGSVGQNAGAVYTYRLNFRLIPTDVEDYTANVDFYVNTNRDTSFANDQLLASNMVVELPSADNSKEGFKIDLSENFFLDNFKFPEEAVKEDDGDFTTHMRLTRMKTRAYPATALTLGIRPAGRIGKSLEVFFQAEKIEEGVLERPIAIDPPMYGEEKYGDRGHYASPLPKSEALEIYNDHVEKARGGGYVGKDSYSYIPENATKDNWDFDFNRPTKPEEFGEEAVDRDQAGEFMFEVEEPLVPDSPAETLPPTQVTEAPKKPKSPGISLEDLEDVEEDEDFEIDMDLYASRTAQYDGFYYGDVPDSAVGMLGTSSVDASQVRAVFGKTDEAIQMVNQFDPSLLEHVSFIFNFAKSGAYGVFLSELDRDIKTKELAQKLEAEGYKIEQEDGGLTAYPTREEKTDEEIKADIDKIYSQIESRGGTAFGINTNSIVQASQQDASESQSPDPEMWEWIAVLHLGGTIVHEAVHAKGHMDEGPSESAEGKFNEWALPIINQKYQESLEAQGRGEEFAPLTFSGQTRHAARAVKNGWYKTAQFLNYVPLGFFNRPTGSDLGGRFPGDFPNREGRAPWGMLAQQSQGVPIESRLSREYMSPLPQDIVQEHQHTEEQLRRYTRGEETDPNSTTTELLESGHDDTVGYTILEGLLEEMRPTPLMVPLEKAASIEKKATLFGWMNNLEVSDGNTIPGLSDRVMAWEDRDEDFAEEESWIKKQPRYNPTYDIKGFYYRWIEPRFHPQLFDDMTRDYARTHPAKRWASTAQDNDVSAAKVMSVLAEVDEKISGGRILSTRMIMTDDILPVIERFFEERDYLVDIFSAGDCGGEEVSAVWISAPSVDRETIVAAEKAIDSDDLSEVEDKLEELFRVGEQKKEVIDEIINGAKEVCEKYKVNGLNVIGGYVRDLILGSSFSGVRSVDFAGNWPNQTMKVGGLLAKKLGVKDVEMSAKNPSLSFVYRGVEVNFLAGSHAFDIEDKMASSDIPLTCLNREVCSRDFTANMMVFDVCSGEIRDVCGKSTKDIEDKMVRTFVDPEFACAENPLIILKALAMARSCGFGLDRSLRNAMRSNAHLLFESEIPKSKLIAGRESVKREGKRIAAELFEAFGLQGLEDL